MCLKKEQHYFRGRKISVLWKLKCFYFILFNIIRRREVNHVNQNISTRETGRCHYNII